MKPFGLGKILFELSPNPFGLSPFPFGLSLSKPSRHWVGEPFDKLSPNGNGLITNVRYVVVAMAFFRCTASAALVVPLTGSLSAPSYASRITVERASSFAGPLATSVPRSIT